MSGRVLLKDLSDRFLSNPELEFPRGKLVAGKVLSKVRCLACGLFVCRLVCSSVLPSPRCLTLVIVFVYTRLSTVCCCLLCEVR